MTALLMALILCVGMVSGTNKEVRAQSASQNSETQTASESDVTTENTANIAENTTKSAATVTHHEYTTEEVKETIQGIFEWAKSLTNADELIDKTFLEGADTSLNDWFAFAAARSGYKEDYKSYRKAMETAIAKKYGTKKEKLGKATEYQRAALVIAALGGASDFMTTRRNDNNLKVNKFVVKVGVVLTIAILALTIIGAHFYGETL